MCLDMAGEVVAAGLSTLELPVSLTFLVISLTEVIRSTPENAPWTVKAGYPWHGAMLKTMFSKFTEVHGCETKILSECASDNPHSLA